MEIILAEPEATELMCAYCFDILIYHFHQTVPPRSPPFDIDIQCPLFVTLNKSSGAEKSLRGCIGTLRPTPLETLKDYVHSSAFRDHRFSPVESNEIQELEVAVSLLIRYEKADGYLNWEVGIHGVIIEFLYGKKRYSATYLPEVAAEQRWTQRQTIESLIRKTGYRGEITTAILNSISLTRYQSSKAKLSYSTYIREYTSQK